jgi:hypothetical protein
MDFKSDIHEVAPPQFSLRTDRPTSGIPLTNTTNKQSHGGPYCIIQKYKSRNGMIDMTKAACKMLPTKFLQALPGVRKTIPVDHALCTPVLESLQMGETVTWRQSEMKCTALYKRTLWADCMSGRNKKWLCRVEEISVGTVGTRESNP